MSQARPRSWLRDTARFEILYADRTAHGSVVTRRCDAAIRAACQAIIAARETHGMPQVVRRSRELLEAAFRDGLADLYERPGKLREQCLYPPTEQVVPAAISVASNGHAEPTRIPLDPGLSADLAPWLGELARGASVPRSGRARALFEALDAAGLLHHGLQEPQPPVPGASADLLWVGHATVQLGSDSRVLVDPFLFPRDGHHPEGYPPLSPRDLRGEDGAALAGVLITHSHPDHYDLWSLLQLGADTPIFVPLVERESLLAIDMAHRLEQLGFRSVQRVTPGDVVDLGGVTVTALPFRGEQPTTGERLHPEVANVGCTYRVDTDAGHSYLLLVDSGRDLHGDVRAIAAGQRAEGRPVDVVIGGHRGFALYPIHYLFSSVLRYLLFVPERDWEVRQQLMNDAHDLIDCAELAGARAVVPYADGGAPWHWSLGLGPRLDGGAPLNPAIDPLPESVRQAAAARSTTREGPIASPVLPVLLHPGEGLRLDDAAPKVVRDAARRWPYGEP